MDAPDREDRSHALFADGARLRMLAGHLVVDTGTADDLVQETWVAALHRAPSGDRPLGPWLAQVIRNLARRKRRGDARRSQRESAHADARDVDVPSAAEIAERLDAQRALVDVLGELDESLRTTLVLRYFEELSSVDIARAQGVPEGTVRWRIQRGLAEMRERLDRRFGGSRGAWCALFLPLTRPGAGSLTVAGEGVVAMGVMAKIGAAIAITAMAGVLWWGMDDAPATAAPYEANALAVEGPSTLASTPLAAPASVEVARQSAPPSAAPVAASVDPSDSGTEVVAATDGLLVDARFLDAAGAPWQGVRLALVDDDARAAISGADGRATLRLDTDPDGLWIQHREFIASGAGCATRKLSATVRAGEPAHLGDVVLVPASVVHGRVVGADGRPVPGARVGTTKDLGDTDLENVHRRGSERLFESANVEVAADGHFELTGVQPGLWRVWAGAEGSRFAWTEPLEVQSSDVYGIELVLEPLRASDRIGGVVVDGKGQPVPNATLWIYYSTKVESGTHSRFADAEGRFDLVVLRSTAHTIVASDPEHEWADSALERIDPGALELVLRLGERRYVDVDVRDAAHEPVAGCSFEVTREDPMMRSYAPVETGAAGRYRVGFPNFAFRVAVRADGYRTVVLGPYDADRAPEHLDVVLEPVPIVGGRVVADGKPIAGVRVTLHRANGGTLQINGFTCVMDREPSAEVETDADGRFMLGCETTGEIYVRAQAHGWAGADAGPLAVPRTETTVDLELTHGGAIEGRVILPDGKNAEGAIVGANRGDGSARTVRAGPGGIYRFESLTPGKWQIVSRTSEVRPDTMTSMSLAEPVEIQWSCEVVAGKTTHHDLDATQVAVAPKPQ